MSLEWDTTFGALFIGRGLRHSMVSPSITVYKGSRPSAETITNSWSNYKIGSANILAHYRNSVWSQQPVNGNLLGLSTVPPATAALGSGDVSWGIIWFTDITNEVCASDTLPHAYFIVVDCSTIEGKGVIRFSDTAFITGVNKAISEATIEVS